MIQLSEPRRPLKRLLFLAIFWPGHRIVAPDPATFSSISWLWWSCKNCSLTSTFLPDRSDLDAVYSGFHDCNKELFESLLLYYYKATSDINKAGCTSNTCSTPLSSLVWCSAEVVLTTSTCLNVLSCGWLALILSIEQVPHKVTSEWLLC